MYTKEGETADAHIEKLTHELARKHKVTVVTSDGLEQIVTMGQGAIRMSSRDFKAEVERVNEHLRENYLKMTMPSVRKSEGGQFGRLYNGAGSGNDQLKGDNI